MRVNTEIRLSNRLDVQPGNRNITRLNGARHHGRRNFPNIKIAEMTVNVNVTVNPNRRNGNSRH